MYIEYTRIFLHKMLLPQCFPQISSTITSISSQHWYETNHTNQITQSVQQ